MAELSVKSKATMLQARQAFCVCALLSCRPTASHWSALEHIEGQLSMFAAHQALRVCVVLPCRPTALHWSASNWGSYSMSGESNCGR
eukprot:scaffold313131_cov15-Tisochrysis_lutea.AAC.1